MKKQFTFCLFIMFSLSINAQVFQNVLYGERSSHFKEEQNVNRIFIDKKGDLYPDIIISDSSLQANNSSIHDFYETNEELFKESSSNIGLEFTEFSEKNYLKFQNLLFQRTVKSINNNIGDKSVYILIHGFRNPITPKNGSTSAKQDNDFLRNAIIEKSHKNSIPVFVEVYWDGMYDCCFGKKAQTNKRILELYENVAQINASNTGYSLRNIVSKIEKDQITIITHSLGSQVAISMLTNSFDNRINSDKQKIKTPEQQTLNICLIAPAISSEPFNEYFERNSSLDYRDNDNYKLTILYNEKDFALKKKWKIFGPGPIKYGNTSLGCNHKNEIGKLENIFKVKYKNSYLKAYNTTIGRTHSVRQYAKSDNFALYINSLTK